VQELWWGAFREQQAGDAAESVCVGRVREFDSDHDVEALVKHGTLELGFLVG
jgi:hypothetical protein